MRKTFPTQCSTDMLYLIWLCYLCARSSSLLVDIKRSTNHGPGDDNIREVDIDFPFKFIDKSFTKLYISYNGGIFADRGYRTINLLDQWSSFPSYSLIPYWSDAKIKASCASCALYTQMNIQSEQMRKINNIFKEQGIAYEAGTGNTLAVTWYNLQSYETNTETREHWKNTFQMVITSNNNQSYAIYSYDNLTFPAVDAFHDHPKIGFYHQPSDLVCKFPDSDVSYAGKLIQLTCQSNVNLPGVFLVGLTTRSAKQCPRNSLGVGQITPTCTNCIGDDTRLPACGEGPCSLHPCLNGGTCVTQTNTFQCVCTEPWSGTKCEKSKVKCSNNGCSEICEYNENMEKQCYCRFKPLAGDEKSCVSENYFLISTSSNILVTKHNLHNSFRNQSISYQDIEVSGRPVGMFLDRRKDLYFTERENMTIRRWNFDEPIDVFVADAVDKDAEFFRAIAFDSLNQAIFWAEDNIIWKNDTTIFAQSRKDNYILSMVIEQCTRMLIWCQNGDHGGIYSKSIDIATADTDIIYTANVDCLTLNEKKVYFAVSDEKSIESINVDGSCHQVIGQLIYSAVSSIAYYDNAIFMTFYSPTILLKYNITLKESTIVEQYRSTIRLFDIVLLPSPTKPDTCSKTAICSKKSCDNNNGECQQLCEERNGEVRCFCERGVLQSDEKTCSKDSFIYLSLHNRVEIWKGEETIIIDGFDNKAIICMDFDYEGERLFYSENFKHKSTISVMNIDGSYKTNLYTQTGNVDGLAYDSKNNLLYYTQAEGGVYRLNLSPPVKVELVLQSNLHPRALLFDSCIPYLFISFWSDARGEIHRIDTENKLLIDDLFYPNALTMDRYKRKLYWADAFHGRIESSNMDGTCREIITFIEDYYPFGMVFTNNNLLWVDWVDNDLNEPDAVMQTNLKTRITSVYKTIESRGYALGEFTNRSVCSSTAQCMISPPQPVYPPNNIHFYPYGPSAGDMKGVSGDDNSTSFILSTSIPMFGDPINTIHINTNGYLTFTEILTSTEIILPSDVSVVAVYAVDLNGTQDGSIYYRQTSSQPLLVLTQQKISENLNVYFTPKNLVIITWELLPSYDNPNLRNTFQVVLASDTDLTFALFFYKRLDAPSGVVGFSGTNQCYFQQLQQLNALLQAHGEYAWLLTSQDCFTGSPSTTPKTKSLRFLHGVAYGDSILEFGSVGRLHFQKVLPVIMTKVLYVDKLGTVRKDNSTSTMTLPTDNFAIIVYSMRYGSYTGNVYFRVTDDLIVRTAVDADVNIVDEMFRTSEVAIVTFDNVPAYDDSSKLHSFQAAIATDYSKLYVLLSYTRLDLEGATAGLALDMDNYFRLVEPPESLSLTNRSNVNVKGLFVYEIIDHTYLTQRIQLELQHSYVEREVPHVLDQPTLVQLVTHDQPSNTLLSTRKTSFIISVWTATVHPKLLLFSTPVLSTFTQQTGTLNLPVFTTQKHCISHRFSVQMSSLPVINLNVRSQLSSMNKFLLVWLSIVSRNGFEVCFREQLRFSGIQADMAVDYVATTTANNYLKEFYVKETRFIDGNATSCQRVSFSRLYNEKPLVFVTAQFSSANVELLTWVHSITKTYTVICTATSGTNLQIKLHIFVVSHTEHRTCVDGCSCLDVCSHPRRLLCASDLNTYVGVCDMQRMSCERYRNISSLVLVHYGMCRSQVFDSGTTKLKPLPEMETVYCERVHFNRAIFPLASIQILLTLFWNSSDHVHHASATWSEDLTSDGFRACAMVTGRLYGNDIDVPCVYWSLLQKNDLSAVESGVVSMPTWLSGTRCVTLNVEPISANVFVSLHHSTQMKFSDAATVWVERGAKKSACARELQNFDGIHRGVDVHWMTLTDLANVSQVKFGGRLVDSGRQIEPACETVQHTSMLPSRVFVTVSNSSFGDVFSNQNHAVWIESNSASYFVVCHTSTYTGFYRPPVNISYAIFYDYCSEGFAYDDGRCYKTLDGLSSHGQAVARCNKLNATLVIVNSETALVTKQASWLGLTYFDNRWQWQDGSVYNYSNWSPGQPDFDKNCAVLNRGEWHARACSSLHAVTCSRDVNLRDKDCACERGYTGERCQIKIGEIEECNRYQLQNQSWRRYSNTNNVLKNASCDRDFADGVTWFRFADRLMADNCTKSRHCCGVMFPGWVVGGHPTSREGIVTRTLGFFSFYCASDYGTVMIRYCQDYYVYRFLLMPRWSCDYGVCVEPL